MPRNRRVIINKPRNRNVVITKPTTVGGSSSGGNTGQIMGLLWMITNP